MDWGKQNKTKQVLTNLKKRKKAKREKGKRNREDREKRNSKPNRNIWYSAREKSKYINNHNNVLKANLGKLNKTLQYALYKRNT